jgi:hypothetical protein
MREYTKKRRLSLPSCERSALELKQTNKQTNLGNPMMRQELSEHKEKQRAGNQAITQMDRAVLAQTGEKNEGRENF